jgi:hypothetical protein
LSKYSYNTHILLKTKNKTKQNRFFFLKKKNDNCKINLCGWLKLQIAHYRIKNNSKVFKVGKKIIPFCKKKLWEACTRSWWSPAKTLGFQEEVIVTSYIAWIDKWECAYMYIYNIFNITCFKAVMVITYQNFIIKRAYLIIIPRWMTF